MEAWLGQETVGRLSTTRFIGPHKIGWEFAFTALVYNKAAEWRRSEHHHRPCFIFSRRASSCSLGASIAKEPVSTSPAGS